MDLTFSEEQKLLQDSAQRFLADRCPTPGMDRTNAGDESLWGDFARMGWLALPLPEAHGGLGQGMVEVGLLMEAFGRRLVTDAYVPTVVLCGGMIAAAGSPAQRDAIIPAIAAGDIRVALAHTEERARFELTHVETTARRNGAGFHLDGRKTAVLGGDAQHFVVSARLSGATRDAAGIGLFLLPRQTEGLSVDLYPTIDRMGAAIVTLDGVKAPADSLLETQDAAAVLRAAVDRAICAGCAELVGIMQALIDTTVEYTRTRIQFGQPLAANQVLRHRMADMSVACEEARSMALRAALMADEADAAKRTLAASAAKVKVGRAAKFVAEQAVQLHGGMGVTDELNIGAYLRRVVALDIMFGPAEHHLRRHAALSGRA